MSILGKLVIGIVGALALCVGALYVAALYVDDIVKRYESSIERWVGDALGGELRSGGMSATVFPRPRLELREVSWRGREGFGVVEAERLGLEFELVPLLWRSVEIGAVTVTAPRVLVVRTGGQSAGGGVARSSGGARGVGSGFLINLKRFEVVDGRLEVSDSASGRRDEFEVTSLRGALRLEGGDLAISGAEVRGSGVTGWGTLGATVEEVRFSARTGELGVRASRVEVGGIVGALDGVYGVGSGVGRFTFEGEAVELQRIESGLGLAVGVDFGAALDGIAGRGAVKPSLAIEMGGEGKFRINGMVGVTGGGGVVAGVPFDEVNGMVRLALADGGGKVAVERFTGRVGGGADRVAVDGELEVGPLRGQIRFSGKVGSLAALSERVAALGKGEVVVSAGQAGVTGALTFANGAVVGWGGVVEISEGGGTYRGVPFQSGAGKVRIKGGAGDLRVTVESFSIGLSGGAETLVVRGDLAGAPLGGTVEVSSAGVKLSTVAPIFGVSFAPEANPAADLSGDIKVRIGVGPVGVSGAVSIRNGAFEVGGRAIRDVSADVGVVAGDDVRLTVRGGTLVLDGESITLGGTAVRVGEEWRLSGVELGGFGGRFGGEATVQETTGGRFSVAGRGVGLGVERLWRTFVSADEVGAVSGELGDLQVRLGGTFGEGVGRSLEGEVAFRLERGALRGVNIGRRAIEKVATIPLLGGALIGAIPADYRDQFEAPDTPLRVVTGKLGFSGGLVTTDGLKVVSELFGLDARGRYELGGEVDLAARLYFERDFAVALARRVRELGALFGPEGTIVVPLVIAGQPTALRVLPDVGELLSRGARGVLEREASRFIEGALERLGGGEAQP